MGILKRMFGTVETADKLVDGAMRGLDKAFFTAEERAGASENVREWYIRYLESTQPQNVARRWIAVLVVALWCALVVVTAALGIAGSFGIPGATEAAETLLELLVDVVLQPFSIIIAFYFLTHSVRAYRKSND